MSYRISYAAQARKQQAASAEVNKELMSAILNNAPDAVADLMNVLVKMVLKPWDWRDDVCGGRTNKPISEYTFVFALKRTYIPVS